MISFLGSMTIFFYHYLHIFLYVRKTMIDKIRRTRDKSIGYERSKQNMIFKLTYILTI